jgi:NTE family protein
MADASAHRPRRALVLGGGGVSGIAWETGVLAGLMEKGIDPRAAETVIGTSAGSIVGARLLGDPGFAAFMERQTSDDIAAEDGLARELAGLVGLSALRLGRRRRLGWLLGLWMTSAVVRVTALNAVLGRRLPPPEGEPVEDAEGAPNAVHAKVGRLARVAPVIREQRWLELVADLLGPVRDWPDRLRTTAIDAEDGRLVAFHAGRGASVLQGVAASTALPILLPPVVIDGRPYVDGGLTSETNCLLASGCDDILILAPLDRPILAREIERLRAEGSRVTLLVPSAEARLAVGSRMAVLDPIRRAPSARAGFADGIAAAAHLPAVWRAQPDLQTADAKADSAA